MSQNYSGRLAVVLSVLLIALLAIFWPSVKSPVKVGFNSAVPFSQKVNLKPGIDIKGGTSLLYEIKAGDQGGNTNLAQEMVSILKQRVDPSGLLNLVWRPHGSSQIEIQMPFSATSGEAAATQKQLDDARANWRQQTSASPMPRMPSKARTARPRPISISSLSVTRPARASSTK